MKWGLSPTYKEIIIFKAILRCGLVIENWSYMEDDSKSENENTSPALVDVTSPLPLLPLRDVVVFPHMVIPLFVGRAKSIKAMEMSMEEGNIFFWQHKGMLHKTSPRITIFTV